MTSTTSSAKTKNTILSMIISSIKKVDLLLVAYSFLLFISFPIIVLLLKANKSPETFSYIDCGVFRGFSTLLIATFTVIFGVVMFNIYHNKRSVDLYASLPLKRQSLFMARYFAGLIMLIVPLVVFMIVGLLVSGDFSAEAVGITFYKMLGFILSIFNGYSMIALISMLCGGLIDTIITYAVVNAGVAGSIYMTINLIAFILPGYNENALYGRSLQTMALMLLSPFGMPIMVGEFTFTKTPYSYMGTNALADEIIIMSLWAVLTVIYFVAAMIIAKIRKNENVQSGFIFKFPKIVIQVIASVGIGLISGFVALTYLCFYDTTLFFYDTTGTGVPTLLIFMAGALLGSLGAFIITTLVYNRGTKRFVKDLPIFGGSFALLAVFYLLISTGLVGGVMNVPDVDKIKSVSVNSPAYNTYLGVESPAFVSIGDKYEKISYQSEDKQYRESVVALHQAIVDNIHNEMGMFFNMNWIYEPFNVSFEPSNIDIVYELNNGKKIIKAYAWYNYDYEDIKDEYNGVLNTDAFKNQHKITKCDTAEEANVSMIGISQSKRYSNNPLYDTTNESDYDIGEYGATITEEEIIDTDNEKSDFYDSEFISQVYSTLRDEFVADKNLSKTMRTAKPEYVETDDVPDEIVYSVRMNYDIGDVISEDDLRKANDIEDASSVIMDSDEEYFVTKDTYPNTWKLIDDYMQSNNRTSAFIYSDAA